MMNLKRQFAQLGLLAIIGGSALLQAPAAQADSVDSKSYPTCGAGGFCVWDGSDFGGAVRFRDVGDSMFPSPIEDDDNAWRNNGYYQSGADHIRVYDTDSNPDWPRLTLCIHRGAQGRAGESGATKAADDRGDFHNWGGECKTGEPQLN